MGGASAPGHRPRLAVTPVRVAAAAALVMLAGAGPRVGAAWAQQPGAKEGREGAEQASTDEISRRADPRRSLARPPAMPVPGQPVPAPARAATPAEAVAAAAAAAAAARQQPGAQQPGEAPAGGGGGAGEGPVQVPGEMRDGVFRFGPFSEPVDVKVLADLVFEQLGLEYIATDVALRDKKVLLPTQITLRREQLLPFLSLLLEQNGQVLSQEMGLYVVRPGNEVGSNLAAGEFATTQVIPTPGIKPSAVQGLLTTMLSRGAAQGVPAPTLAFLDDLGLIIATATPRQIEQVRAFVQILVEETARTEWTRFEIRHIAAPVARQRVLELLGRGGGRSGGFAAPQIDPNTGQAIAAAPTGGGGGGSLSNLSERLKVDFQGNSLLFQGRFDEQELLRRALRVVDVVNTLQQRWWSVGRAEQIISVGQLRGLGQVIRLQGSQPRGGFDPFTNPQGGVGNLAAFGQPQTGAGAAGSDGGSVFLLDPEGRGFVYYGTPEQQLQVERLVEELKNLATQEDIIYEFYKLRNAKAEDVSEVVRGLISNQVPTGTSPLLPGGDSRGSRQARTPSGLNTVRTNPLPSGEPAGDGTTAIEASEDIFVLADAANNQVVVKAPRRLQPQFRALIERLDLRRPQVFIEAQIVVLTNSDDFRLAFETQLINAGGTGGVARTNFGLTSTTTGTGAGATTANILTRPTVSPLAGLTAAVIKSDQVPIIINALANTTDARLVASPRLLVDDNEEAQIESIEQRSTGSQTVTDTSSVVSGFGGYEDAGPKLTVTPRISSGDYLSIDYEFELSNFVGTSANPNFPPPRQRNRVSSKSVTIPSDSTIVVGGLTFDQNDDTVIKIPFLGDIPIVGQLFRDEQKSSVRRTIYIFLTPRIVRDRNFDDLRILTRGPAAVAGIKEPLPPPRAVVAEVGSGSGAYDGGRDGPGRRGPADRPPTQPAEAPPLPPPAPVREE